MKPGIAALAAQNARKDLLKVVYKAKGGHLGGSLSVVDILSSIYACSGRNVEVILSKGHCLLAWLAVLHQYGLLTEEELLSYYCDESKFGGHPKRGSHQAITWGTGSLGHGLSVSCGKALGNQSKKYICVLGDGECNEGSVWEGLMFASQHKLTNLAVVIDNNGMESLDRTSRIMGIEDMEERLDSFGFDAKRIDGHSHVDLCSALSLFCEGKISKPIGIVADTIKGKGVSFMENVPMWHHRKLKPEEIELALEEIEAMP